MRLLIWPLAWAMLAQAQWQMQTSGSTASLRGISAVSQNVAWASGSKGTVLRTTDGGKTWLPINLPGAEKLDFRGIRAWNDQAAVLMSSGPGELSRVYRTSDAGAHWELLLQNKDTHGFFDSIAFWDTQRGILIGDPVDGHIYVATTADGGQTWKPAIVPASRPGEGGFAASNTCVAVSAGGTAWIATGGTGGGRIYVSTDRGRTWTVVDTPIRHDGEARGIFSIAFRDTTRGVIVGGDYSTPAEDSGNAAFTGDGGRTWKPAELRPKGYRSAVAHIPGTDAWIAVGTTGTDLSKDGGITWTHSSDVGFNALSFAAATSGWAVGEKGAIARWTR